jgi:acyl-CoA reductase-like NAD-dependent aldehyde dehydrogenase
MANLPPGVINVVFGDGATTGAALVASPLINGVSFTGGTKTGIAIRMATAAQIGKHLSLELGGKNPTLVFADALQSSAESRERAIRVAAAAAFENQGEICLCGSRIYVEKSVYKGFVDEFAAHVHATFRIRETMGAVASREHFDKIRGYLVGAREEGATFVTGSPPAPYSSGGYWIEPTILTDVKPDSVLLTDEIFGPVVTIMPFEDEEDAIRLGNASEYGLAAVLMTTDGARMRRVGEQLEAGLVWVNCWLVRELGTPFGGMKNSGTGREGGEHSRHVFTVARTLHLPAI